jgi:hypothetical protein
MAENAWQTYADQVLNRFDYDTNDWSIMNVCSGAAIYGHDGALWASAGDEGSNLTTYDHPLEELDGSVRNISVNEVAAAIAACDGNRKPTEAGIRMGGGKFMMTWKNADAALCKMTRMGGGACAGKTASAVVIGFWKKDGKDSTGQFQNDEACYKLVEEMTNYLTEQGY